MAKKPNGRSESGRQKFLADMQPHLNPLRAFAISLSGNVTRAEDLVQETVLRALQHWQSFKPGTNMGAWLFTILRNLFLSQYRKSLREVEDPDNKYARSLAAPAADTAAEASADFNRLLQHIACLPPDQRDALIAVGYLQLSYDQASDALGCAVGTIKSRVNRARNTVYASMDGAIIHALDMTALRSATKRVPKTDPFYPIALAYEELYADVEDIGVMRPPSKGVAETPHVSRGDKAWEDLVASGVLDEDHQDFGDLLRTDQYET